MQRPCSVITDPIFTRHNLARHEERSERLMEIDRFIPDHVVRRPAVPASFEDLARVHDIRYIRTVERLSAREDVSFLTADTYISPGTFDVARHAAGSSVAAAVHATRGEHCFALVRPPGHHASRDRAMGFCIFNNAAVAAAAALATGIERVAILDWDLHHGNGTQEIFYSSDQVLFCSVHQQAEFPGSGWVDEIGEGEGRGFTMNAPLAPGATLADLAYVFDEAFIPALVAHDPGLIIISAGQDMLGDDPKGGMNLWPADYGTLTRRLMDALKLPLALVLEGGYGPSQKRAVGSILEALAGIPFASSGGEARRSTRDVVRALIRLTG
ncbi:MAG: histone deacetylase [Methanospirillum sp.]|nr:histone deacetylase [Methanospirillum sp.]